MNRCEIIEQLQLADSTTSFIRSIGTFGYKRGTTGRDCLFVVVDESFFDMMVGNDLMDTIDDLETNENVSITVLTREPEDACHYDYIKGEN